MLLNSHSILSALKQTAGELLAGSDSSFLVLDLDDLSQLRSSDLSDLVQWISRQFCPVIGLGSPQSILANSVDVVVESASELQCISRRILANPQAATVLVQVLRTIEHLPALEGLVVESLGYATLQSGAEHIRWLAQHQQKSSSIPNEGSGPPILVERENNRLTLVLNRPENDNAYSVEMRNALVEMFTLVNLDESIELVNITANGRCFSTGGDLSEFGKVSTPTLGHLIRSEVFPARLMLANPERFHVHVHKACIGSGLEIPACAGRLTAAPKTLFWLPELSMGLIPGAGGCVSISKRIGRQRTAYMVLMNKKIDAQTALDWGLIDAIEV